MKPSSRDIQNLPLTIWHHAMSPKSSFLRGSRANFQQTDTCVQTSAFNGNNNHAEAACFNCQLSRDTREAGAPSESFGAKSQMAIWPREGA